MQILRAQVADAEAIARLVNHASGVNIFSLTKIARTLTKFASSYSRAHFFWLERMVRSPDAFTPSSVANVATLVYSP